MENDEPVLGPRGGTLVKRVIVATNGVRSQHLRSVIVMVWLAFLMAFLASNFFVIARLGGFWAAIQFATLFGPTQIDNDQALSNGISIRFLFGLAAVASAILWFFASVADSRSRISN